MVRLLVVVDGSTCGVAFFTLRSRRRTFFPRHLVHRGVEGVCVDVGDQERIMKREWAPTCLLDHSHHDLNGHIRVQALESRTTVRAEMVADPPVPVFDRFDEFFSEGAAYPHPR
ncbi:MAG TPA: hypothetical protein VN306_13575, partial [Mycobacterium sp.]|nr:hypothetical protein [Mycobacterium sp.]